MLKNSLKLLILVALFAIFAESGFSQTLQEWQTIFVRARETAIFENGKIRSVRIPILEGSEKTFNFEHSQDGNSVTIVDEENYGIEVTFDEQRRIAKILLPENGEADFIWSENSSRGAFLSDIIFKENGVQFASLTPGPSSSACLRAAEAAAAASVMAFGVCASAPGSSDCWSATAAAAFATVVAYRVCRRRD